MATDTVTGQPIYHGAPRVGLRNVGSYQISGEPWISGSECQENSKVKRYQFPYVTREITVDNWTANGGDGLLDGSAGCGNTAGAVIRVHFASGSNHTLFVGGTAAGNTNGDTKPISLTSNVYSGRHYYSVGAGSSITFRAKCKEIYVATPGSGSATYRVVADLTNIPTNRMYELKGSGHTD